MCLFDIIHLPERNRVTVFSQKRQCYSLLQLGRGAFGKTESRKGNVSGDLKKKKKTCRDKNDSRASNNNGANQQIGVNILHEVSLFTFCHSHTENAEKQTTFPLYLNTFYSTAALPTNQI